MQWHLRNGFGKLSDLSAIEGMPLTYLQFDSTSVADLTPLRGMPLEDLRLRGTTVTDFSTLDKCKSLVNLAVSKTKITPAQVAALQKALPNCKIEWDDPAKAAKAGDFVPLFNGRDLTGWKTDPSFPGNWRVENGVIVGTGGNTYLFSERSDYGDFHLAPKMRVGPGTSAGIFFRVSIERDQAGKPQRTIRLRLSSENQRRAAQTTTHKTGSVYISQTTTYSTGNKLTQSPVPADEWFTLDVIAEGNHIVVQVNGTTTTDIRDPSNFYPRGRLPCLFTKGQPQLNSARLKLRELPAGATGSGLAGSAKSKVEHTGLPSLGESHASPACRAADRSRQQEADGVESGV